MDSSRIDSEQATRVYTQSLFAVNADAKARNRLESSYRKSKDDFRDEHLKAINDSLTEYQFALRTSSKSNLGTDLLILEDKLPLDLRGKGRQCLVKTSFALQRREGTQPLHVLLLEEPENHLSHANMRKLVEDLSKSQDRQLVVATHSSMISSRLDLRKALLLGIKQGEQGALSDLSDDTARFFSVKVAVLRDNDGNWQKNCVDNYEKLKMGNARVFADQDDRRSTFEICMYEDNKAVCEGLFGEARKTLTVKDYMLANKADAAFELLDKAGDKLVAPKYIQDAIAWIRQ